MQSTHPLCHHHLSIYHHLLLVSHISFLSRLISLPRTPLMSCHATNQPVDPSESFTAYDCIPCHLDYLSLALVSGEDLPPHDAWFTGPGRRPNGQDHPPPPISGTGSARNISGSHTNHSRRAIRRQYARCLCHEYVPYGSVVDVV